MVHAGKADIFRTASTGVSTHFSQGRDLNYSMCKQVNFSGVRYYLVDQNWFYYWTFCLFLSEFFVFDKRLANQLHMRNQILFSESWMSVWILLSPKHITRKTCFSRKIVLGVQGATEVPWLDQRAGPLAGVMGQQPLTLNIKFTEIYRI